MTHKQFLTKFAEKMDDSVNIFYDLNDQFITKTNLNDQLVIKKYLKN